MCLSKCVLFTKAQYTARNTFGFDTANGAEGGFDIKWNLLYSLGKPLHFYDTVIVDNKFCSLVHPVFVDCIKLFAVDKSTIFVLYIGIEGSACRETYTHVIECFFFFSISKAPL